PRSLSIKRLAGTSDRTAFSPVPKGSTPALKALSHALARRSIMSGRPFAPPIGGRRHDPTLTRLHRGVAHDEFLRLRPGIAVLSGAASFNRRGSERAAPAR